MINYQEDYNKILDSYSKKLKEINMRSVKAYRLYQRLNRITTNSDYKQTVFKNIRDEEHFEMLSSPEEMSKFFYEKFKDSGIIELVEELRQELKEYVISNNIKLNHVSNLNPALMGRTILPHYAVTQYNESEGDFVFASSNEFSKLLYCARVYNQGLIRIAKKDYIIPINQNLNIEQSWLGLKRYAYNYVLSPKNFMPVVTLSYSKVDGYKFVFEDEWVSTSEEKWGKYETINEITDLLDEITLYIPTSTDIYENLALAEEIKTSKTYARTIRKMLKEKRIENVGEVIESYKIINQLKKD